MVAPLSAGLSRRPLAPRPIGAPPRTPSGSRAFDGIHDRRAESAVPGVGGFASLAAGRRAEGAERGAKGVEQRARGRRARSEERKTLGGFASLAAGEERGA